MLEAALLKEGKLTEDCSEVIFVYTDREIRIRRLMKTRGYDRKKCEKIIALQLTDKAFRAFSTAEIDNSGSLQASIQTLEMLFEKWGVPKR